MVRRSPENADPIVCHITEKNAARGEGTDRDLAVQSKQPKELTQHAESDASPSSPKR